jgi:GNAT superfamily N-acetyltransferase
MPVAVDGAKNLLGFVAATSGPDGSTQLAAGGGCGSSPIPFANGYLNAALRWDDDDSADEFLDRAVEFFGSLQRPFVVWALDTDRALIAAASSRKWEEVADPAPAMAISSAIEGLSNLHVRPIASREDEVVFGDVAERGFGIPAMAWSLDHRRSYDAGGAIWAIASDGDVALGVGTGFLADGIGGLYSIATLPEYRGRGVGAVVTAWLTNQLLERGASTVVLQASAMGRPVYEHLGFVTYGNYRRFLVDPRAARRAVE